ncbi:uncharacterized protein JCM6883_005173 [Sporobolomyces salmoneus]|uniref:uncharacterized protein n=1 Tax=Sporobolomyces salmoneus TaxID=183962 RepID=UPI00317044DF
MGKKSNAARFPLARIKKMIQTDEDVGKVAQATPIVVSKALELFLASLVEASVKDAESRGSQKLTAYGLKRAINATSTLDFCADIVEGIPDPQGDEEQEEGTKKKRQSRKKKAKDEDEEDDFIDDGEEVEPESRPKKQQKIAPGEDEDYEAE